jgi:late control gene D protein (GPD)
MQHENLKIEIEGSEIEEVYDDLVSLEVELDEDLASMFRLHVTLMLKGDTWNYLDDERLTIWKKVVVTAGLEDDTQELISAYITHVRPIFGAALDQCHLEIWGMDASVLMDREDKRKDWPNKKDSDIATEIFGSYGLTPQVEDTSIVHDEKMSTIIQHETDIQFLKRLALRNGYECFVDGETGYFQPPQLSAAVQPILSVQFGDDSNVSRFQVEVNALATANITMSQMDRDSKDVLDAMSAPGNQHALGANGADTYLGAGMTSGVVCIAGAVTTGVPEMTALCQGLFDEGEWFVTGEGEVAANKYGSVLKPRAPVTIKGIGETYSGIYYVTHVNHIFTADGYTQHFRVKRNGLMPTGEENFSADTGGLLGGLV